MKKSINALLSDNPNLLSAVSILIEGCQGSRPNAIYDWDQKRRIDMSENVTETVIEKPPLGIMLVKIWREHRVVELLDAVRRYVSVGLVDDTVCGWMTELNDLMLHIKGSVTQH